MKEKRRDNHGYVLRTGESQDRATGRYHFKIMRKGRRYTVSASTLKELRRRERPLLEDIRSEIHTSDASRITLNSYFDRYLSTKTNIRDTSRSLYLRMWNYNVRDTIGLISLADLTASSIRVFYADCLNGNLMVNGCRRKLSINTVRLLHEMIHPTLELAVDDNLIRKNPAGRALKNLTGAGHRRQALSILQQEQFFSFLRNSETYSKYDPIFTFALSTGLRSGELTALQWSDIDLNHGIVDVNKQLIYKNATGKGHKFFISPLKTEAGRRTIPLTQAARQALFRLSGQNPAPSPLPQNKEIAGYQDYVFRNEAGTPFTVHGLNDVLRAIVASYNKSVPEDQQLPPVSMHILRHCFCSRCAESGMNPKTLQILMGHSSIATTMDIYTDLDAKKIREEICRVEDGIIPAAPDSGAC